MKKSQASLKKIKTNDIQKRAKEIARLENLVLTQQNKLFCRFEDLKQQQQDLNFIITHGRRDPSPPKDEEKSFHCAEMWKNSPEEKGLPPAYVDWSEEERSFEEEKEEEGDLY
mmetsp:Transcript_25214/g.39038  ORF Transcript_25214/g.39038 Transcript_25214/m.39038 type:complete len:113 (+) Transcript_25214:1361-1699(+)